MSCMVKRTASRARLRALIAALGVRLTGLVGGSLVTAAVTRGRGPRLRDPGFVQALEDAGIDAHDFAMGMKEALELGIRPDQEPDAIHAYRDLMMPALVRVCAVTPRTRALLPGVSAGGVGLGLVT